MRYLSKHTISRLIKLYACFVIKEQGNLHLNSKKGKYYVDAIKITFLHRTLIHSFTLPHFE